MQYPSKSPDEIKRGLETCAKGYEPCSGNCTYEESHGSAPKCMIALQEDVLAYIQQLEEKVSKLEKRCDAEQLNATHAITELAEVKRRMLRNVETITNMFPKWINPDGSILCPYCGTAMRMIPAWEKTMPDMGGNVWTARGKCPACGSITPEMHGRTAKEANAAAYAAAQWGHMPQYGSPKEDV